MYKEKFMKFMSEKIDSGEYTFLYDGEYIEQIFDNNEIATQNNDTIKFSNINLEDIIILERKPIDFSLENLLKVKKSQLNDINKEFQITIALNENDAIIEDIEEELFRNGLKKIEGLYTQKKVKIRKEFYANY